MLKYLNCTQNMANLEMLNDILVQINAYPTVTLTAYHLPVTPLTYIFFPINTSLNNAYFTFSVKESEILQNWLKTKNILCIAQNLSQKYH